jgi:hypothetical protein
MVMTGATLHCARHPGSVVDATYSPDATPADLEELDRVVRSLEFGP